MNIPTYLYYFLLPFAISLFLTPLVWRIAMKKGVIAYPREDRWHKRPTALLGGISIYCAVVIASLCFGLITRHTLGIFLGATLLFFVGLADDKLHLMPSLKLFMQIIAACIAIFLGSVSVLPLHYAIAIPITLFWIVGVTNSFNLLDNIDGLAAGTAAIAAIMLFCISLVFTTNPLALFGLILAGAALGFLPYNFNPAKIFMGDSGSMFLGYILAVVSIAGTGRHITGLFITMLIPVLILSVPIFDTIFVMIARSLSGRNIFAGGKDHTSHRLVTLGLSQRKTVLLLYAISILFGSIAFLYSSRLNLFMLLIVTFLALVVLLFFGLFLFEVTTFNDPIKLQQRRARIKSESVVFNNIFMHKRRIVEVLLDLAFICIAYYSSYFLCFEGQAFSLNVHLLTESLLWVICLKLSVFFIFGLYRGVWRYVSISDLLTVFKVVSVSSIAAILFLTFAFRFHDYSRRVFFIDWILLLLLITGSRVLFRVLGEFLNSNHKKDHKVLIFGAGDTGEMVVREMKRNKTLNYNPMGFIDDNPSKAGMVIQGVTVLGGRDKIKALVPLFGIQEILISISMIAPADLTQIIDICKECGITYRQVRGILDQ